MSEPKPTAESTIERRAKIVRLFEEARVYPRPAPPITIEEILSARDEGRK